MAQFILKQIFKYGLTVLKNSFQHKFYMTIYNSYTHNMKMKRKSVEG